jgi:hypothetical protein
VAWQQYKGRAGHHPETMSQEMAVAISVCLDGTLAIRDPVVLVWLCVGPLCMYTND